MIAVTGANGLLGSEFIRYYGKASAAKITRAELDFTIEKDTLAFFEKLKPDCVIHCGAYSKVDMAETERELCFKTNVLGTRNIVKACLSCGAKIVYLSSDYVFDGKKKGFYTEDDLRAPLSVYGLSKAEGEDAVISEASDYLIIRTSWLFGRGGKNFVSTILKRARGNKEISVVGDQVGSPTYTKDLVKGIDRLIKAGKSGIYNITNSGECTWAELAEEAIRLRGLDCTVRHITSKEYGAKAIRPANSRLDRSKYINDGFSPLPSWQEGLKSYIDEMPCK